MRSGRPVFIRAHMKKIVTLIAALLLLSAAAAQQRGDLRSQYEEFRQNRRREYQDFKAKANAEFAEFLKQAWKEYPSRDGEKAPIPVVMPEPERLPADRTVPPLPEAKPDLGAVRWIAGGTDGAPADARSGKPSATPARPAAERTAPRGGEELALNFYGDALRIPWSGRMAPRLASVDEDGFSALWSDLSESWTDEGVKCLAAYAGEHGLNGWGIYRLVSKVSEEAYGSDRANERIAMQAWLLTQLEYRAQVAVRGSELVLLLPFAEPVYGVPYLTLDGMRHYIFGYGAPGGTGYRTYENRFAGAGRMPSLAMDGTMDVGLKTRMELTRWSKLLGERLEVPVSVGTVALLLDCPLTDGSVYYRQGVFSELASEVLGTLRRRIAGMQEAEAVGCLLHLVQNGFDYATDESVFGRQKQLFIEESFFYGRNNCKDRVGVFSWLVRELTSLDVIFVRFEGNAASSGVSHIACAVCFSGDVPGDAYRYKGRRYVMCDPTYINAGVGRTMPCYAGSEGIVLAP